MPSRAFPEIGLVKPWPLACFHAFPKRHQAKPARLIPTICWRFGIIASWSKTDTPANAPGRVACAIAFRARMAPDAAAISYVEDYFTGHGAAYRAEDVPDHSKWDVAVLNESDIRKVTTFNVAKARKLIAHYTAEALSVQGSED